MEEWMRGRSNGRRGRMYRINRAICDARNAPSAPPTESPIPMNNTVRAIFTAPEITEPAENQ